MAPSKEDYVDHYAVLGLPSGEEGSKLSLKEIRKAYRKQSRFRHPDKRPDDPNATADFQLLTSSFEFLLDKAKRSDFDAKLRARREQVVRDSFQDAKRRKMATDLEERERSAAVAVDPAEEVRLKEKRKADELKKEIAEFKAKKASESVCGQQNGESKVGGENAGGSLDKGRTLKVSWEPSAGDYGAAKLRGIFESFGIVEDVVIRSNNSKKKASAFIVMASREAVVRAVQSMSGEIRNPLLVLPLEPIAPMFSDTASTNQNESMGPGINNVVGVGFQDYEAFVMKKLQEANEKKKCMR
ncbi:dnaJ homolog subfamily C member 17 [Phalaenopsis equestris]|uniref:dnaJ homolog subfamily C member 17 n=1 Tax=Phalaenopsis equestris TaxID=78828 RepID=UPI0009E3A927|nr:dnaJ homolog subfamily C member 17 [Phalaenopsis equestris]XP_020586583.1 dnaJ homolog subfamily C member 17 [Phalaenopsis equestris]